MAVSHSSSSGAARPIQASWSRRFFLAVAGTALAVVLLEGLAWATLACTPSLRVNPQTLTPDPILNHAWLPNLNVRLRARGIQLRMVTNSQGWLETYDVSPRKEPGVLRVFFLGDSTTQGVVDRDFNLVELLERRLNQRGDRPGYELVNTGTSSYSPTLYYLLLNRILETYELDGVVINLDMTDVANDAVYRQTTQVDASGAPIAALPLPPGFKRDFVMTPHGLSGKTFAQRIADVLHHSHLHQVAVGLNARAARSKSPSKAAAGILDAPPEGWLGHEWSKKTQEEVRYSMSLLQRGITLARSKGAWVVVTSVPHHPQYTGRWSSRPHEVVRETAVAAGAFYLDTFDGLRPLIAGTEAPVYYWQTDPTHFNQRGNEAWAGLFYQFLDTCGVLQEAVPESPARPHAD